MGQQRREQARRGGLTDAQARLQLRAGGGAAERPEGSQQIVGDGGHEWIYEWIIEWIFEPL